MNVTRRAMVATTLASAVLCCGVAAAAPTAETSLNNCQNAVRVQGKLFLHNYVNAVGKCLQRVSTEVVKKNAPDVASAANTCIAQFRKLYDTRGQGKSLEEKARAKIEKKCLPGGDNTHTLDDVLGSGTPGVSESLEAEKIGNWCGQFGASGAELTSLTGWIDCVLASHTLLARTGVTVSYPRGLEYLDEVRPAMVAKTPPATDPTKVSDALMGLDLLNQAVEGLNDDNRPATQAGTSAPATGQTTSYGPGDDGDVRAGAALRYVDNGDGTITDLNTGLMWEKKSLDGSIHDRNDTYTWCADANVDHSCDNASGPFNGTLVSVFLSTLNTPPCFAGHCDWRMPNRFELESILDLQNAAPAVDTVFNTGCAASCTVDGASGTTMCSCTGPYYYWSSTSYQGVGGPGAWTVYFNVGSAGLSDKSTNYSARAVRGGT